MSDTTSTDTLDFTGQVALVTGAGRGLGREHALLLASRGCKVVVNDLGSAYDGTGAAEGRVADEVVDLIKASGGDAVANYDSVEDGQRVVDAALDAYGRLDIVVNNAGILTPEVWSELTLESWQRTLNINLTAVFSIMKDMERKRSSEIYQDGLVNVLSQPEFAHSDQICRIVETLQRRSLFESIVEEILSASGVQVIIGGEGRWGEMENLSLVLARYGIDEDTANEGVAPHDLSSGRSAHATYPIPYTHDSPPLLDAVRAPHGGRCASQLLQRHGGQGRRHGTALPPRVPVLRKPHEFDEGKYEVTVVSAAAAPNIDDLLFAIPMVLIIIHHEYVEIELTQ